MMRWYKPVLGDNTVARPLLATRGDLCGLGEPDFLTGRPIVQWRSDAWVGASDPDDDGEPDDALQNFLLLPIFSQRLQVALSRAGVAPIQYLPLRVRRADGSEIEGYAIANVLAVVPALDLERSTVERFDKRFPDKLGQLSDVRNVVLKSSVMEGLHIIRLLGFERYMCVSDAFRRAFVGHGCSGYSFYRLTIG